MTIFRTESGFKITGRGFVLTGEIVEGPIRVGNKIVTDEFVLLNGKEVKALEYADNIRTGIVLIGLIIAYQTVAELEALKSLDLKDKQIQIKE